MNKLWALGIMGLLSLPLSSKAQNLDQWLKTLEKPVAPKVECDDVEPEYCEDFFSYACNQFDQTPLIKKIPDTQESLDKYFGSLTGNQKDSKTWSENNYSLYLPAVDKVGIKIAQSLKLTDSDIQEAYEKARSQLPVGAQSIKLMNATQAMNAAKAYAEKKYHFDSKTELEGEVIGAYNNECGVGGTKAQIFTLPNNFIHVCPGFLLKLAEKSFSKEELLHSLETLFLHEFNHSMVPKTPTAKLQSCYLGKIGVHGYDEFTKAEKATAWKNQSQEITADTLASKSLNAKFRMLNLKGEAAAKALSGYSRLFCSQGADTFERSHPGGRFRMNIFTGNSEMRERMGCKPKPANISNCSL